MDDLPSAEVPQRIGRRFTLKGYEIVAVDKILMGRVRTVNSLMVLEIIIINQENRSEKKRRPVIWYAWFLLSPKVLVQSSHDDP
jgi:hypothetical protein